MVFETKRFVIEIGIVPLETYIPQGGYLPEQLAQYLVRNKETGVVEFCNASLYFVRDWALQMDKALEEQDQDINRPEVAPIKVIPFPGGDGGRTN